MSLPSKLYKYESFSAQSLENLKAQAIYFGSPLGFNDPYDCATQPVIRRPSIIEAENIREHGLVDEDTSPEIAHKIKECSISNLQDLLHKSGTKVVNDAVASFLKERGVSCFSEKNDSLQMWAHYASKYKGFCLEFSTSCEPLTSAKKVSYLSEVPEISVLSFLLPKQTNTDDPADSLFCMKHDSWAYEKEWRVLHATAGTLYCYKPEALTGVYFGPEISSEAREIVCLILKGQNSGVKFWGGKRSKTQFKVEFEEFNYLSYLEAKNSGLI